MTESELWQKIKTAFSRSEFSGWVFTRIETATVSGVPDIHFTNGKINGWIELKTLKHLDGNKQVSFSTLELSANQIHFSLTHANCFYLVAYKDLGISLFNSRKIYNYVGKCLKWREVWNTPHVFNFGTEICPSLFLQELVNE